MKFVIMCKKNSKVKLTKKCKSRDLTVMAIALLQESIKSLSKVYIYVLNQKIHSK